MATKARERIKRDFRPDHLNGCENCGSKPSVPTSGLTAPAMTNWAMRRAHKQPTLCSACDPEIDQWHGEFPRVPWDEAEHGPHDIERMCR